MYYVSNKKKRRKEKENGIVKYNKYVNVKFISSRRRTVNIPICCIINTFFSFWQKAFSKCRSSVADPNEICKQISRHAVYFMQILSSIKSEDISILLCVNLQRTHYMLYGDERIQMGWSLCYLFVSWVHYGVEQIWMFDGFSRSARKNHLYLSHSLKTL